MRGLEGKNVIVTGAASGIGRATARRLLEEGVNVFGADVADTPTPPERSQKSASSMGQAPVGDGGSSIASM